MGKQTGGWLLPGRQREAHQIPTLKMQGAASSPLLPSCSFKMEGAQTPSSGAAIATARRQPSQPRASAERNKNSFLARARTLRLQMGLGYAAVGRSAPGCVWPRTLWWPSRPGQELAFCRGVLLPKNSRQGRRGEAGRPNG